MSARLEQREDAGQPVVWDEDETVAIRCMRRSRSRQNPASARSGKLVRSTASSSPGSRVLVTQASLGPVSESMAERESASAKLDPPRVNGHRRSRSWYMTGRKDRDDLRMPEEYHGTTNATDSRASRTRGWLWSRTRDATEPAAGTDNAVTELLDSADEEVPSLTGIPSPSDGKQKRGLFSSWRRSSKAGEPRQGEGRAAEDYLPVGDDPRAVDARGDGKTGPMAELDSTDAASTTQSAGSSTPDARNAHEGTGPDSSRPNSRQSGKDDDSARKPSRHTRRGSFFDLIWAGKTTAEGTADVAQDAGVSGKIRSKRGEAAVKKADVSGAATNQKSARSCFGMPQVADDDAGSESDAGPPLIEGLTEGAIGMRNLCNTCFINATLQCLRATPGLLEHLAPELLADPARLPQDLIEPLSAGPPIVQLDQQDPAAASPRSCATATEHAPDEPDEAARHSADNAGADSSATSTPAPGPGAGIDSRSPAPPDAAPAQDEDAQAAQAPPEPRAPAAAAAGEDDEAAAAGPAKLLHGPSQLAQCIVPEPLQAIAVDEGVAQPEGREDASCAAPHVSAGPQGAPAASAGETTGAPPQGPTEVGDAEGAAPECVSDGIGAPVKDDETGCAKEGTDAAAEVGTADADQPGSLDGQKSAVVDGAGEAQDGPVAPAADKVTEASKEEIARDLVQVMAQLAVGSGSDPVAPRQLYRDMANNEMWAQFSNGGQHDAHELLRFVMSVLHEVHDRVTDKPPYAELEDTPDEAPAAKADRLWGLLHAREASALSDLFQGQLESRVTCSKCSSAFHTYEPFMDLSLSLFKEGKTYWPNKKTIDKLEDCFRAFTEEEKLDEPYFCPTCRARHTATKALRIHRFPRCLVLHIKRFKSTNRTHLKLSSNVTFPLNGLNLAPFSTALPSGKGATASRASKGAPGLYDLYAVSNHTGSLDSGHYTSYVKVADLENDGEQKWLLLADDKVSDAQADSIVSAEAYMLFYVQRAQK